MKHLFFSLFFIAVSSTISWGQDLKLPALSPTAKISQEFSTSNIELTYSRPSMRGRKIFGDLVAFGNVWRTGANSATKIKIGEELEIGGQIIKPGEYALYTIPGKEEWEVILNKGVGNWGAAGYNTGDDVARFKVKSKMTEKTVQTFTMEFTNITLNSCKLELTWEKTRIVIPIIAHNEERLSTSIDKAINNPNIPYFQAANYYYETDQHLDKANMYVDKSLETNPKAFYMWWLKARIEKKMGHKKEAIAAAQKAIETAQGSAFEAEYKHNAGGLITELQTK